VQERHCRRVNLPSAALNSPAGCLSVPCQTSADPCRLRTPSASATGRGRSRRTTTSAAASAEGTGAGLQERLSVYSLFICFYIQVGNNGGMRNDECDLGTGVSATWLTCQQDANKRRCCWSSLAQSTNHEDEVRFGFVRTNAYVARMVPLAYPP
jgi:hypothetical protein